MCTIEDVQPCIIICQMSVEFALCIYLDSWQMLHANEKYLYNVTPMVHLPVLVTFIFVGVPLGLLKVWHKCKGEFYTPKQWKIFIWMCAL
jgi:hypothetical protein